MFPCLFPRPSPPMSGSTKWARDSSAACASPLVATELHRQWRHLDRTQKRSVSMDQWIDSRKKWEKTYGLSIKPSNGDLYKDQIWFSMEWFKGKPKLESMGFEHLPPILGIRILCRCQSKWHSDAVDSTCCPCTDGYVVTMVWTTISWYRAPVVVGI